jgi:hypothetical protein
MPTRNFNAYSEKVVVYAGETFNWFANESAFDNGDVSVQSSANWPLTPSSCVLSSDNPAAPVSVSGQAEAASSYPFSCVPGDPGVTNQTLIIARQYISSLCNNVQVYPGDHFIWHNTTQLGVTIAPSPDNADNWPLAQPQYDLNAGDWVAVPVPADAETNEYDLTVTYSDGSQPCGDLATQPKLSVGGGPF